MKEKLLIRHENKFPAQFLNHVVSIISFIKQPKYIFEGIFTQKNTVIKL